MNAPLFPSSRPNIIARVQVRIPATMVGAGGIGVNKENGIWTIEPQWDDLILIAPGVLLDPSTKEIWVHDPATDVYNRMSLLGLAQSLWTGTSTTPIQVGTGVSLPFTTQANKDWPIGSFVIAYSAILNPLAYMIGRVKTYVDTQLVIDVPAGSLGSAGFLANDWIITRSAPQGGGAAGPPGPAAGLNYQLAAVGVGDPNPAGIGFDSATVAAITLLRVSHTDRSAADLSSEVATWDDSTNPSPPGRARVRVYSTTSPSLFVIATLGGPETVVGAGAGGYSTFPLILPTGPGLGATTVGSALQVEILRTGNQGTAGANGSAGAPGADGNGAGARYNWLTPAAATDPGAGKFGGVNSVTPSAITSLRISKTTAAAQGIGAFLATIDDSTTVANRGTISFMGANNLVNFAQYFINGPIVDGGTFVTVPVTFVATGGAFANGDLLQVLFSRTGDAGASGSGSGDMIGSVNLAAGPGGVANAATALSNLGGQPLDADLTAIAALATTAYGRGFLTLAVTADLMARVIAGSGGGTTNFLRADGSWAAPPGGGGGTGDMIGANNLAVGAGGVANAATSRTNLGLGTAATQNTGTSGANVPLLNGANTFSAPQRISDATATSNSTTGALQVVGGIGAGGGGSFGGQLRADCPGVPIVSNSTNFAQNFWLMANGATTGFFGSAGSAPLYVQNASGLNIVAFNDDTSGGAVANGPTFHAVAAGNPVALNATGSDTNIDFNIVAKGTGKVNVTGAGGLKVGNATLGAAISGGFSVTSFNAGNIANTVTFTPNPANGNYQFATNTSTTGCTIAAPATDCAIDILWTNTTATVGAVTFSGFTVGAGAGAPTLVANAKFMISIRRINSISTYSVLALQ